MANLVLSERARRFGSWLSRSSPVNAYREGHVFVVLKSYFDGNEALNPNGHPASRHVLTLTGYIANDETWTAFEGAWQDVLRSHRPSPEYMHMQEAMQGKAEFSTEKGWNAEKIAALVKRLTALLQEERWRRTIHPVSCAIDADAHARAISEGYPLDPIHKICVRSCVMGVSRWGYVQALDSEALVKIESADFFFDQNEDFMGHFHKMWNENQWKTRDLFWGLVNSVAAVSMRKEPAIQAVDMLAWSIGRQMAYADCPERCLAIMDAIPYTPDIRGYDDLVESHRKVIL